VLFELRRGDGAHLPELRRRARAAAAEDGLMTGARHLYVHLPFCAHRCGYCDFVTAVGREGQHGAYVDALLAELELERGVLGGRARPARMTSAAPCTFCVMPDLTTARSISSTGFPARAPPTSTAISPRRSRSGPSTCPATSWRPSRARASPTGTVSSWSARPS